MWGRVRKSCARFLNTVRAEVNSGGDKRTHNLFEAAAAYVSACAEDDQDRIDEAAGWVSPEALSFGVNELACRAVIALARERDESPGTVARELLGLPAA
ncbi:MULTISPECIES: hypothetical protein [unclassified Streptomyces]|uniref:hypothetical protein n=1 Tax=unclassified Streptomyces TaxID=2593676 RepID=UPI00225B9DA2|nr:MULTISPECIES: hypothetical protein [unclassified Streptomyces]MCX5053505.1 hypothetical protein [Streptomyces sp. NBC_00474]MCX5059228.1 hypothetical protein [Streptomyces sp. NBC_00452]MCX5244127.1 hypothetical protein [Streptomyces sp. NBC_00201]MCX5290140.1 hypothetical protein [Streptomyces sp. NBC_00183]